MGNIMHVGFVGEVYELACMCPHSHTCVFKSHSRRLRVCGQFIHVLLLLSMSCLPQESIKIHIWWVVDFFRNAFGEWTNYPTPGHGIPVRHPLVSLFCT